MGPKSAGPQSHDMFRQRLDELVNLQHPLARLAQHIDWQVFEQKWAPHFPSSRGGPARPTRMIAGLLYLQHIFALSDEDVLGPGRVPLLAAVLRRDLVPAPATDRFQRADSLASAYR